MPEPRNPFSMTPNRWNQLIAAEVRALRRAIAKGTLRFPVSDLTSGNLVPGQQEPFAESGTVTTPAPGTFDQQILSFDVEKGFGALITGLAHGYQGNLYNDYSGDIVWELMVDYRFFPQYGQLIEVFGAPMLPRPVVKGIPVGPGQNVAYLATIPATSPIATGAPSYLFGAVFGIKFPVK